MLASRGKRLTTPMDDAARGLMLAGTALAALDVAARSFLPHVVSLGESCIERVDRGLDLFERAVKAGERVASAIERVTNRPLG